MGLKELLPSQPANDDAKVQVDLATQAVLEEIVNKRRREMLLVLEQQHPLSAKDLSLRIWELEQSRREPGPDEHSVYTSVNQNHIPRFVDAKLVVMSDGVIRLTDRGESVVQMVRLVKSVTNGGDYV